MSKSIDQLEILRPAPGHYVISGHNPRTSILDNGSRVVPPDFTYISPELPSEVLEMILEERSKIDLPPRKTKTKPTKSDSAPPSPDARGDAGDEELV